MLFRSEGWAEWVPAEVLQDPFFRWDNGASLNLETPGWTDGQVQGDTAEGRIAGALIDLSDNTNEAPWDRYGEDEAYGAQFEEIFTTSNLEVSNTFNEYFNTDRPGEGDTGFLARTAVFANTIDYTQRDPLFNLSPLTRPSLSVAPSPHNYSFNTVSGYWSGVAVRGANDNDLTVYDDAGQTASLASSAFGGSTIDYVLVDSNERSLGDYYPRVNLFAGSGPYDVEWAAGATSFAEGSTPVSFGTGDVIQVRDAFAAGGVTNYVRVVPSAGLDLDLFAHDSTSGTPATYVQGRPAAVASSASGGLGAPEAIQYTVPETDWTGLVLLNKSGSGTATVYRDQSAPTGASVVIDSGAATTYDRQVDLGLSAADSQTGIMDMRVSVDGTFDTETFEPYATSKSVTLPTGDGTKTVKVEFRNNAGAVTQASDTIDLHEATVPSAPTVTSSTPRPQQIAVAFTPGSDGGAPVSNFTAQCVSTDGGITKSVGGAASPITVTGLSDQKSYHCHVRATNPVGTGAWSAYGATVVLPAPTAPDAPTVTDTTPGAGKATVAFSPGFNGGSPVTNFTAQCVSTDGGVTKSAGRAASPITVTGLSPLKSYHCRVRATNAVGVGAWSGYGSTVAVQATVPGAPTVTSTTPGPSRATVGFTPGSDGGSPITNFTAQCVSTDGGVTKSAGGPASPITVTALTAGHSYHCHVRATNAVGTGTWSGYGSSIPVSATAPQSSATQRWLMTTGRL